MSEVEELLNKVLDASANTIWDELKKIRESSETEKNIIRRRWIWELIQNASDCTPKDKKIDIKIVYSNNKIIFSHNGLPFSYRNLLDLITQISSKQSSEEKKTGKFGTGFMSTHLLSEIVKIEGSFIQEDSKYTRLNFTVDRSGSDYSDIKSKTQAMLKQLKLLRANQEELQEEYEDTKFIYSIEGDEIKEAIEKGILDLKESIPYVLAFNENINSITYNGECYKKKSEGQSPNNGTVKIVQITNSYNNKELLTLNKDGVTISCAIERKDNIVYFLPISNTIPKVFCEFPLLGTEEFSFPIVVNSELFEVERDRNAIRDSNLLNMQLIQTAIDLYKKLLNFCSKNKNTRNEFNICILNKNDSSEIQANSYQQIKEYIDKSEIVPIHNHVTDSKRLAFKNNEGKIAIGIPSIKQEIYREHIWDIFSNLERVPTPTKDTYSGWFRVFGSSISFSWINDNYLKDSNIDKFVGCLKDKTPLLDWLNKFYALWIKDEGLEKVLESVFVPNQNDEFVQFDKIYLDRDIEDELKQILKLLGVNIKNQLLNQGIIAFEHYFKENNKKIKTNENCSDQIDIKVSQILSKETIDRVEREESTQKIFNKLTNWFLTNPEKSKEWFENLYSKRMMLSSPEENLRRYKIAEKIEENNIKYEELDEIISNRDKVMEIINNSELSKEDIIDQLKHIVTSSEEMQSYVENLLCRSRENVFKYLSKSKEYTLPATLEEWLNEKYSDTVFPVKYKGDDIRVVIRPSDYQKIIFYYDEELEALDDYAYQLWTDDGEKQVMVTLGDLLKTTGISKIPLTKI
ncbi:ATP-binding protein [Priestia megaterium]|uniref:ATP-binding protein n=1 Tax=Priestia megaterium TaxID=1404 RepID=UPI0021AD2359|nr:ATP-binding protein [Priestia megaterium]MCR8928842.1 ATP-binding protein [Priestia megaterium]